MASTFDKDCSDFLTCCDVFAGLLYIIYSGFEIYFGAHAGFDGDDHIPLYLVIAGVSNILFLLSAACGLCEEDKDKCGSRTLMGIFGLFIFIWWICGTVWLSPLLGSGIPSGTPLVKRVAVGEWGVKLALPILKLGLKCVKKNTRANENGYQSMP